MKKKAVNLKVTELVLHWPINLSLKELRPWILSQLREFGEPLRWAITEIDLPIDKQSCKKLRVEAVILTL